MSKERNTEFVNPTCIEVTFENGTKVCSEDFVVIVNNNQCDARMFYNADAVTLGQAIQMISYAYTEMLAALPEEQAQEVREALAQYIEVKNK